MENMLVLTSQLKIKLPKLVIYQTKMCSSRKWVVISLHLALNLQHNMVNIYSKSSGKGFSVSDLLSFSPSLFQALGRTQLLWALSMCCHFHLPFTYCHKPTYWMAAANKTVFMALWLFIKLLHFVPSFALLLLCLCVQSMYWKTSLPCEMAFSSFAKLILFLKRVFHFSNMLKFIKVFCAICFLIAYK